MQQNKELSNFIKAMKRNLKSQFGISVPHSALRASYLLALGENPHAFAGKQNKASVQSPSSMAHVLFEWVYPDESGDAVEALLDLTTGQLLGVDVPEDVIDYADSIRTRINVGPDEALFDTYFRRSSTSDGDWYVEEEDLGAIREEVMANVEQGEPVENVEEFEPQAWYCVSYKEQAGDKFTAHYYCSAASECDACYEAEERFPAAEIGHAVKLEGVLDGMPPSDEE